MQANGEVKKTKANGKKSPTYLAQDTKIVTVWNFYPANLPPGKVRSKVFCYSRGINTGVFFL